jgi:hypothetical protein
MSERRCVEAGSYTNSERLRMFVEIVVNKTRRTSKHL